MSAAVDFTYQYAFPSALETVGSGPRLRLATCTPNQPSPYFFDGSMREPRVIGDMMLVLSDVVRTHFFLPRPPLTDPVLTSTEAMLRLEGFSGCCGVYARVDLTAEAFEGEIFGRGTTNVDFNNPMRAALTRIRPTEEVRFAVGRDEVALERSGEKTVEKKVRLPLRWIKGFSEVQAYQPSLELVHEVPASEGLRFLRTLPTGRALKRPSFVVASGPKLRLSQREKPGAIRLSGTHRVRILEPLLSRATALRIWKDDGAGTSAWEVLFEHGAFFLMVSPEVERGFSGEGQVLSTLAGGRGEALFSRVRAELRWQSQLDARAMASRLGAEKSDVEAALAILGARGLAGYDASSGHYFHRELPFDLSKVESLQPRLLNARKLVEEGHVRLVATPETDRFELEVKGSKAKHFVRLAGDIDRCTCQWFSKHQGERGPCKHILASRLLVESKAEAGPETAENEGHDAGTAREARSRG